jgi:hypothetical protein
MRVIEWLFLPVFVIAGVFAFRSALDRFAAAGAVEGFETKGPDTPTPDIPADKLQSLKEAANPTPSDADAIQAHKTLLKYIQNDYKKGVYFALNIGDQFFGPGLSIRKDMDPSTILANYHNPLQGV